MHNLSAADKAVISQLNRGDVTSTFAGLKAFFPKDRWLGPRNRYSIDMISRLHHDVAQNSVKAKNLAQYISASAVLHVNDGWSYLGRAVASLLRGDAHVALHLAYYAELRAAMGLLAGSGIGVFKSKHFVLDAANQTKKLGTGLATHIAAWEVLDVWSQLQDSSALLTSVVRPNGYSLDDWFATLGGSLTLGPQARDWFLQWGMDLKIAVEDREARNESSYRPDGIPDTWTLTPSETVHFVQEIWQLLEPSENSSFGNLDRQILRRAVENYYRGTHGREATATDRNFVSLIEGIVANQGLVGKPADQWREFLTRAIIPQDTVVFSEASKEPTGCASDSVSVISRSVLLLRIATGSANRLIRDGSLKKEDLRFWWSRLGTSRGLWNETSEPENLTDLWIDIGDALQDLELAEIGASFPAMSLHEINKRANGAINVLSSHERVALWGICPT